MMSLWGKDFELIDTKAKTKSIVNKTKSPKNVKVEKAPKNTGASLFDRINSIKVDVLRILGVYKENTITLKSIIELRSYVDAAIKNDVVAIDTETNNSLDPLTCKIMGLCLYTPGQKNAYIPVNHTTMEGERYDWQVTEDQIKIELERIKAAKVKTIWHNAKFDYKVIKCTCNCEMPITWDTIIGARILNENELADLKYQYIKYVDPSIEKYDIESLFEDINYAIIDPELFALYAATDSFMTYKLYEYQQEQFKLKENAGLQNIFNIEMQVIIPTAEMELTGVCVDIEFAKRLSDKWHHKKEFIDEKLNVELDKLSPIIEEWRKTPEANFQSIDPKTGKIKNSKNEQLKTPINLLSPTQLAILLYDVLKVPVIDKQNPRGTGEEIIAQIKHPLCSLILEQRGIEKLLSTYIDKIPQCLSPKDNRLHTNFNQLGANTGRYSSKKPNLQNIPSYEKSIRMMFIPTPGYVMVGSDYSL